MMTLDEMLKQCEAVIYRTEAELERRIKKAQGANASAISEHLRLEHAALVELRKQVQWYRKTGHMLDDKPQPSALWESLTEQQKRWLKYTDVQRPNSFLSHEESKKREAYQLEDAGLLSVEFDIRHGRSYTIYATIEGKMLANANAGKRLIR